MTSITTWNKGSAPAGTSGWNLTPDVRAALESMNVIVPVATQAERDGLTPPLGKYAGMAVARKDIAGIPLEVWDGAGWVRYSSWYAKAVGGGALSVLAAGATIGPVAVTFPSGRFAIAPLVQIGSDQTRVNIVAADVTTSGFNIYATNVTASSSAAGFFRWSADQATSVSAAG